MKNPISSYRAPLRKKYGKSLGDIYYWYADELLLGGIYDAKEARTLLYNLIHSSQLDTRLLSTVSALSRSDADLHIANSELAQHVLKGRDVLRSFLIDSRLRERYTQLETIPLLFGSLEYGDPRNCDVDMVAAGIGNNELFAEGEHFNKNEAMTYDSLLSSIWNIQKMPLSPNAREVYVGKTIYTSWFTSEQIKEMTESNPEELSYRMIDLSIVLTGIPLYPEDNESYEYLQEITKETVASDPLLSVVTNITLQEVLDDRR